MYAVEVTKSDLSVAMSTPQLSGLPSPSVSCRQKSQRGPPKPLEQQFLACCGAQPRPLFSEAPEAERRDGARTGGGRTGQRVLLPAEVLIHSVNLLSMISSFSRSPDAEPPTLLSHRYFSAVSLPNFAHFTPFFARSLRLGARKPETAKER